MQGMDFDPLLTGFDEKELATLFGADDDAQEDDFDVDAELEKPCFLKRETSGNSENIRLYAEIPLIRKLFRLSLEIQK